MLYLCKWLSPVRYTIETRRQEKQGDKRGAKDLEVQEMSPKSGLKSADHARLDQCACVH